MSLLDQARADTLTFLQEWGESLLRRRPSTAFNDARIASQNWDASLSFTGDFQALSGSEMRAEAGLEQKSDAQIIAAYDADVLAGDRVIRGTDTFHVNYVNADEDHVTIRVYKEPNP